MRCEAASGAHGCDQGVARAVAAAAAAARPASDAQCRRRRNVAIICATCAAGATVAAGRASVTHGAGAVLRHALCTGRRQREHALVNAVREIGLCGHV